MCCFLSSCWRGDLYTPPSERDFARSLMHPHTSSFSYRIAATAARLGVLLTPRGLDDVLTASAVCFLALGFWLPIRHALNRAPLFSLASALLQRSCEQLQPYVGNDSTPCRLALFLTLARLPDVRAFSSRSRDISHFTGSDQNQIRSRLRHTTKVPSHLWLTTRSITRSRRPWQ